MSKNTVNLDGHGERKADVQAGANPPRSKASPARHACGLPCGVISTMQDAFFDVGADGALIYMDPMIGALRSLGRQLGVMVNAARHQLELVHAGAVMETFGLTDRTRDACEEAFGAYFVALQRLCGETGSTRGDSAAAA